MAFQSLPQTHTNRSYSTICGKKFDPSFGEVGLKNAYGDRFITKLDQSHDVRQKNSHLTLVSFGMQSAERLKPANLGSILVRNLRVSPTISFEQPNFGYTHNDLLLDSTGLTALALFRLKTTT